MHRVGEKRSPGSEVNLLESPPQKRQRRGYDRATQRGGFWTGLLHFFTRKFHNMFSYTQPKSPPSFPDSSAPQNDTSSIVSVLEHGQQQFTTETSTPCANDPPFKIPFTSSVSSDCTRRGAENLQAKGGPFISVTTLNSEASCKQKGVARSPQQHPTTYYHVDSLATQYAGVTNHCFPASSTTTLSGKKVWLPPTVSCGQLYSISPAGTKSKTSYQTIPEASITQYWSNSRSTHYDDAQTGGEQYNDVQTGGEHYDNVQTGRECYDCVQMRREHYSDVQTRREHYDDVQREKDQVLEEVGSMQYSTSSEHETKCTLASSISSKQETSYWAHWMEDFTQNYKHLQAEQEAVVKAAKMKLLLHQKKRMNLEDERLAKLRKGLSQTYIDSDDENDSKWLLTQQQMERVAMAINRGSTGECLSEKYRIRVTRGDLRTLTGSVWLNDEVINFYFNLISESCEERGRLKVHIFNSFFYTKLSQSGYSGVRRWTKKVNVFAMDLILLPVHLGMHWCLAAIDMRAHQFSYFDSLLGTNTACFKRLREYLKSESQDKRNCQIELDGWSDHTPQDIPVQTNSSDCGVFACMYARHKAEQLPFDFSQDDMTDIRNHMIYEILEQTLL